MPCFSRILSCFCRLDLADCSGSNWKKRKKLIFTQGQLTLKPLPLSPLPPHFHRSPPLLPQTQRGLPLPPTLDRTRKKKIFICTQGKLAFKPPFPLSPLPPNLHRSPPLHTHTQRCLPLPPSWAHAPSHLSGLLRTCNSHNQNWVRYTGCPKKNVLIEQNHNQY